MNHKPYHEMSIDELEPSEYYRWVPSWGWPVSLVLVVWIMFLGVVFCGGSFYLLKWIFAAI